jgi:hypothetical protein
MTAANLVLPTAAALARVRYLVIRYAAHVEVAWVRWLVLSAGVDLRRLTVCCDVNASRILVTALCDTLGRTTVRDFRATVSGCLPGGSSTGAMCDVIHALPGSTEELRLYFEGMPLQMTQLITSVSRLPALRLFTLSLRWSVSSAQRSTAVAALAYAMRSSRSLQLLDVYNTTEVMDTEDVLDPVPFSTDSRQRQTGPSLLSLHGVPMDAKLFAYAVVATKLRRVSIRCPAQSAGPYIRHLTQAVLAEQMELGPGIAVAAARPAAISPGFLCPSAPMALPRCATHWAAVGCGRG